MKTVCVFIFLYPLCINFYFTFSFCLCFTGYKKKSLLKIKIEFIFISLSWLLKNLLVGWVPLVLYVSVSVFFFFYFFYSFNFFFLFRFFQSCLVHVGNFFFFLILGSIQKMSDPTSGDIGSTNLTQHDAFSITRNLKIEISTKPASRKHSFFISLYFIKLWKYI